MTEITLNLTLKELQQIDKYIEVNDDTLSVLMKIKDAYPKPKIIVERKGTIEKIEINGFNYFRIMYDDTLYPSWWEEVENQVSRMKLVADKETYEWLEFDYSKPMNEVMNRLENKYKKAEENAASYITDEVVNRMLEKWEENPPEFLKFEMGKTLEALITRWWCDVFGGINQDWDMETAIDDLIDQIQLWLPKEQDSSGTQDVSVIDLVDGYNDALTKIKSKLRNKK